MTPERGLAIELLEARNADLQRRIEQLQAHNTVLVERKREIESRYLIAKAHCVCQSFDEQ